MLPFNCILSNFYQKSAHNVTFFEKTYIITILIIDSERCPSSVSYPNFISFLATSMPIFA